MAVAAPESSLRRTLVRLCAWPAAAGSALLLAANVVGLNQPLRSVDVDGYRDFANVATLDAPTALRRLDDLGKRQSSKAEFVTEATRLMHAAIAHISPRDVEANGYDHYRMRVPVTENWLLYGLSFLKPDTYRDYEFCSYRRAVERGTGRCGQQSLALVSYLDTHGIETGFVALGGHAIATARVDDGSWYLLDPDYGGVIPYSIETAERDPAAVLDHYWSDAATVNRIDVVYAPDNEVRYGGPDTRYARACPIERAAYALKWPLPLAGLLAASLALLLTRRNTVTEEA